MAFDANILLMDEPFGALDAFTREDLWQVMHNLRKEEPFTGILITHDLRESIFLADEVVVLSGRPASKQFFVKVPKSKTPKLESLYTPKSVDMLKSLRKQSGGVKKSSIRKWKYEEVHKMMLLFMEIVEN